jgi:hypothetical protein
MTVDSLMALIRLTSASYFWKQTPGEKRIISEWIIRDLVIWHVYTLALINRRLVCGGTEDRVLPGGKMEKVKI